ncbi:MAG: hypothetical protein FWG44_05285 [Oscillospiraceae bacterium]|nr:hypothetical protein [Oscillospiraceae bacterium]
MNLYKIKRNLISFLYPNRCPFCDELIKSDEFFHKGCVHLDLYKNSGKDIFCCVYNGKCKPLITKAKENADGYAVSAIAKLLYDALLQENVLHKINIIAPIPPRKNSMKKRGYSFPALLAKELAEMTNGKSAQNGKSAPNGKSAQNTKYSRKLLVLLREIKEQKELSAAERAENLKGAFGVGRIKLQGSNVLIVDDVSTTGSTLEEARRALIKNGAGEVYTAAFAKTAVD